MIKPISDAQPLGTMSDLWVKPFGRLRSPWAALGMGMDALPPFWTAFAFIIAISLPQTFLALPIAVANVGPLAGVVLIAVLGGINMLTVACMAEAVSRSETVRYRSAFIGRIAGEYLGSAGSLIITLTVAILFFLALLASYIGLAATLEELTTVPEEVSAALLFLVELYLLSRLSLGLTVSLVLGVINIVLILVISLIALPHAQPANLLYVNVPLLGGRPFEPSVLQPVFGVALIAYFGHVLMGQSAKMVLPRDPSGRSLVRGSMAGMACLTILLCIWVLAVNGAVAPGILAGEKGTVVVPLAAEVGMAVRVLGSILVTLLLGLTSIRCSNVLFNLVSEWLPTQSRPIRTLSQRRVSILVQWAGDILLGGRGRFCVAASPVALVFLITEGLLLSSTGSFAGLLSLAGITTVSIITGIFPVLLLVASRRKGELVPGAVYRCLGHPLLTVMIYVLFMAIIFLHGLVIWQNPVQQVSALVIGLTVLAATVVMVWRGACRAAP